MASNLRTTYVGGLALGMLLFLAARGWFVSLLRELGYVDGQPGSLLVSALFMGCMLVMCAGYGVGTAVWFRRTWARRRQSGRSNP